jgi:hypothetical protein
VIEYEIDFMLNNFTMRMSIDKTMVARAVIAKLEEERNPRLIKAKQVKGYDVPAKIVFHDQKEACIPDITAIYDEETIVYEIELDHSFPVEKWKQLSHYAQQKNGNLYLVVPDFLRDVIKKAIQEKEINAGIIYFDTNQ